MRLTINNSEFCYTLIKFIKLINLNLYGGTKIGDTKIDETTDYYTDLFPFTLV